MARYCLPCRRSRVRIPSAVQKKLPFAALFRCGSRLVRLHPVGLISDSRSADRRRRQGKRPVCRPILVRPTEVSLQACRRSGVRPAAAVTPDSYCGGTIQRTAPAGTKAAVAALRGQSGSVRKPGGRARRAPRQPPASYGTQSRELLRRRRPTQLRGPHNGDPASRESKGRHRPGLSPSVGNQAFARHLAGLLVVIRSSSGRSSRRTIAFTRKRNPGRLAQGSIAA
jgi:hypothetical protein